MRVLCRNKNNYFVGEVGIDGVLFIKNTQGVEVPVDDEDKLWILDDDGVHTVTINHLINILGPLYDRNGIKIKRDDYITKIEPSTSHPIVYAVEGWHATNVVLRKVYDPSKNSPYDLIVSHKRIAIDWMVIL